MRVILTQNVPKLGEVGDVCDVAPGYGRNFLIPQRLAIPATSGALKQVEDLKRTEQRRQNRVRSDMESMADRLQKLDLTFTAKVGQTGRLYGSITSSDIAERIEEELGEEIDRRKIVLDDPIRSLGTHQVPVHLMPGVDPMVAVTVEPDAELLEDIGIEALEEDETVTTATEAEVGAEPAAVGMSASESEVEEADGAEESAP